MTAANPVAKQLQIGNVILPNRVFMAPMSGVTDAPFRKRGLRHGAGIAVSEMIASGLLTSKSRESLRRLEGEAGGHVHMVQLAGRDPACMAEAARMARDCGAHIIDINMGCPAKKVTGGYAGSALMREPDLALRIIETVGEAVTVPVTVKMRLGWDENALNAPAIARAAESAGVAMLTVHGRTRCQLYKGRADWRAIARVKSAVGIPVVANGDVETPRDAKAIMDASGADAVMIGRGHYGQPWLAGSIAAALGANGAGSGLPGPGALADYVIAHYEDMLSHYGIEKGLRHARKHIGWYLDRHGEAVNANLRLGLLRSSDPKSVIGTLRRIGWSCQFEESRENAA
jgi:nifR3 family TIM-barrel protein